ncbi:ribose-5-phosphate isomerase [Clostridium sp. AWRP]|uniref:ribose-5-phosphate isomerase n=1 Tax=Clostridium sp. AWRP TaxID=2212991 RepID=UPI000FD7ED63|nr:ribose-5-phosphate isomerase [Clostridium sp. AWRP]AZV55291.1 ribose-5-phosphate isomerase [Clostridium sp. AWRP]
MKYFRNKEEVYTKIIKILCEYKGLSRKHMFKILKNESCRYLFFLLIKKYECCDMELLKKDFPSVNSKNVKRNIKRAEEKLLFDKKIREMYFEAEDIINKVK